MGGRRVSTRRSACPISNPDGVGVRGALELHLGAGLPRDGPRDPAAHDREVRRGAAEVRARGQELRRRRRLRRPRQPLGGRPRGRRFLQKERARSAPALGEAVERGADPGRRGRLAPRRTADRRRPRDQDNRSGRRRESRGAQARRARRNRVGGDRSARRARPRDSGVRRDGPRVPRAREPVAARRQQDQDGRGGLLGRARRRAPARPAARRPRGVLPPEPGVGRPRDQGRDRVRGGSGAARRSGPGGRRRRGREKSEGARQVRAHEPRVPPRGETADRRREGEGVAEDRDGRGEQGAARAVDVRGRGARGPRVADAARIGDVVAPGARLRARSREREPRAVPGLDGRRDAGRRGRRGAPRQARENGGRRRGDDLRRLPRPPAVAGPAALRARVPLQRVRDVDPGHVEVVPHLPRDHRQDDRVPPRLGIC
mmetsp:Transcript_27812/g.94728  ORF Transcript_27812/g.94728 Transcript_27812/m.94728 type:complete len:430 (+) Transcript_27812:846-2135(+)